MGCECSTSMTEITQWQPPTHQQHDCHCFKFIFLKNQDPGNDVWIHILLYCDLTTFISCRCLCKRIDRLTRGTKNHNSPVNQYWHHQCHMIYDNISSFYKCDSWEIFYHQMRHLTHLWITLDKVLSININKHIIGNCSYSLDAKLIFNHHIYKTDACVVFKMLLILLLHPDRLNKSVNDNYTNTSNLRHAILNQTKNWKNSNGNYNNQKHADSLLFLSVRYGSVKILKYLLSFFEKDNIINNQVDYNTIGTHVNQDHQSLLFVACNNGYVDVAKLLLKYYHDKYKKSDDENSELHQVIHLQDHSGKTPLHVAAKRDDVKLVSLLLANGADVSIADETGKTPLAVAFVNGHNTNVAKWIVKRLMLSFDK